MRLLLLGPPGSGKTIQAKRIAKRSGIPHVSVGELIRTEAEADTELGRKAKLAIGVGQLVTDELICSLVVDRVSRKDANKGFLLEGYPRNVGQLQALNQLLSKSGRSIQAGIIVDVDLEVLMRRLTGRRICRSCGTEYNFFDNPPRMDDRCDECGGSLKHRADDREATVHSRLRVYESQILPMIDLLKELEIADVIQGVGAPEDVATAIKVALEQMKKRGLFKQQSTQGRLAHVATAANRVAAKAKAKKRAAGKINRPDQELGSDNESASSAAEAPAQANVSNKSVGKKVSKKAVKKAVIGRSLSTVFGTWIA